MTTIDLSLHAGIAAAEDRQTWLPPEAPLDMPRQALEPAAERRSLWAPVLQTLLFRTRA